MKIDMRNLMGLLFTLLACLASVKAAGLKPYPVEPFEHSKPNQPDLNDLLFIIQDTKDDVHLNLGRKRLGLLDVLILLKYFDNLQNESLSILPQQQNIGGHEKPLPTPAPTHNDNVQSRMLLHRIHWLWLQSKKSEKDTQVNLQSIPRTVARQWYESMRRWLERHVYP